MLLHADDVLALAELDVELEILRSGRPLLTSSRSCRCGALVLPVSFDAELAGGCFLRNLVLPWCPQERRFAFDAFDPLAGVPADAGERVVGGPVTWRDDGAWGFSYPRRGPRLGVPVRLDAPADIQAARAQAIRGGILRLVPSVHEAAGAHPFELKIEPTTYCNVKCGFCPNPKLTSRKHLRAAEFDALWAKFDVRYLQKVGFTGLGEALMNPDLWQMIARVKEAGLKTSLVSNGTLLRRFRHEIAASGLDDVAVSIESTDRATYAAQRVGADLDDVLGQLGDLRATLRAAGAKTELHVLSVMVGGDSTTARDVVDLCAAQDLGAPTFYPLYEQYSRRAFASADGLESTFAAIDEATRERFGVNARVPRELAIGRLARQGAGYQRIMCQEPLAMLGLRADGEIMPCNEAIFQAEGQAPRLDAYASVADAWQSPHYRRHRFALSVAAAPDRCRGCHGLELPLALAKDVRQAERRSLPCVG